MEYNVLSVLSVQVLVVGGIAAALIFYLMRFRRSRFIDVSRKSIVVTGCDGGLGLACALRLHRTGLRVFAVCSNGSGSLGSKELKSLDSPLMHVLTLDGKNEEQLQGALSYVEQNLPPAEEQGLWAIVHAASSPGVFGMLEWTTWSQCEQHLASYIISSLRITKAFLPLLRQTHGRFVHVSLLSSKSSHPGFAVHAAASAAVEAVGRTLESELRPMCGLRAITVTPIEDLRATASLSTTSEHVASMWREMALECKRFYKKYYVGLYGKQQSVDTSNTGNEEEDVVELLNDVERAVLTKCPQDRYESACAKTRLSTRLKSVAYRLWNKKQQQQLSHVFEKSFLNEQIV